MNCISLKEQKGKNEMRRGFTLIELMIVIAVMAILIGISLPYFKGMQDEGKSAKAAGELRTLTTGIESFYIHNDNEYPQQTTSVTSNWQTIAPSLTTVKPTIVKKALNDPFLSTQEYSYVTSVAASTGGSEYYVVFSVGPDRIAGIESIADSDGALTWGASGSGDDIYITNAESGVGGF